ncbi:type VI secretion system tip protein TssI/VgrG [Planktotalea sp.]|uniref:type VI secretion system Vgr family protein n=1 Tax=Planktotalea sp. TaxID=2029877 RepID=UPI0025F4AF08|nr:type VI secretion system tip protein TssI/VgrG [Planktotalea sp.]
MPEAEQVLVRLSIDKKIDLDVVGYKIEESLSEVPSYAVTALDQESKLDSFVGKNCEITFVKAVYSDTEPRVFKGIIMSVERTLDASGSASLRFVIQPALAILGLSVHSAIYQKSTSLDILKDVLSRNGLARVTVAGTIPKAKRDTVIQYNENDLAFCRRILAEEGLTFYYHDGKSAETLMLHDVSKPFPNDFDAIELTDAEFSDVSRMEATQLHLKRALVPDKVEVTHYDVDKASAVASGEKKSSETKSPATPSVLEYRHVKVGDLKKNELVTLIQASQRPELAISGQCAHPAMHLGQEIDIASNNSEDIEGRYIISNIAYTPLNETNLTCKFQAVPVSHIPAPERLPKPLIAGVHNAIVVGARGSKVGDIACDEQGRVQVEFFWDKAASNSGYIRVSEPFAGKGYGGQFTPRVGHEVLVSFLHGDPDAPVVTGQVYTETNKPPFAEKNTSKSGFRTQLHSDPNELEFDDKEGSELIAIRAAKNFELIVAENVVREIEMLDTTTIGETSELDIGKDWTVTVKNSHTNDANEITLTGKKKITLKVGSSKIELSTSGILIDAPKVEIAGKSKVDVASKGTLSLEGMSSTFEAKTKLDIKGLNISVKGKAMATFESPLTTVKGSGVLTLKGGMTMIN